MNEPDPLIEKIRELRLDPREAHAQVEVSRRRAELLYPPVWEQVVAKAESQLGFALPVFLHRSS